MSDIEIRTAPTPFVPPSPDRTPGASNGREGPTDVSVRELTHSMAARRWFLLGVAIATFGGVALWTLFATPRYRSEARLRIETQTSQSPLTSALSDQASNTPGSSLLGLGLGL